MFQRDGADLADILITGTYTGGPTAIEARWSGGTWTTIDASPNDGVYLGILENQSAGQGTLEVRFANEIGRAASRAHVGIGDVFVISGQSNASGRGTNNQAYSHATLKAGLFGNNYEWGELADPTDSNNGQVDSISDDSIAAGSYWPLLATQIMAATGYPVAFIPTAKGGTTILQWLAGSDHLDRSTLYGSMNYRANQVAGVKAILAHEGEQDAFVGTTEANFNSRLDTFAGDINTDLGVKLMIAKLQNCTGFSVTDVNNAIATAWGDNPNVLTGPDFSDFTPADGLHFKSNTELQEAADRWFDALAAEFGW